MLLDSYNEGDQSEMEGQGEATLGEYGVETTCEKDCGQSNQETEGETAQRGVREGMSDEGIESHPPPSEWLEDTLIELYLSGYPSKASNADNVGQLTDEIEERDSSLLSADGNNTHGQGDDEWNIDCQATTDSSVDEGASWDEENWRAQYGQVIQEEAELSSWIPAVELWDWSLVKETQKELNYEVVRLVGRLVRPSHKLHPSVPPGGSRLRTAPVCRVHLDLVQVRSGQVYKLRSPNKGYLATLLSYDASNPTKDWGFPELHFETISESCESKTTHPVFGHQNTHACPHRNSDNLKYEGHEYRDRAAERRALHGGFGVGPGQKRSIGDAIPPSSPPVEEAAAEALEMSFGAGSYAHKILKNMGWKEGEALGKTQQGLREPLQGVGNKGTAGLGWDSKSRGRT